MFCMLKDNPGDILYFLTAKESHQKAKTSNELILQTSIVSMKVNCCSGWLHYTSVAYLNPQKHFPAAVNALRSMKYVIIRGLKQSPTNVLFTLV